MQGYTDEQLDRLGQIERRLALLEGLVDKISTATEAVVGFIKKLEPLLERFGDHPLIRMAAKRQKSTGWPE